MPSTEFRDGSLAQPVIRVRVGADPARPHVGTLTIDDWSVPCATGRGGLLPGHLKREGDGATPIGCFPLRYGFFDPTAFPASQFEGLDFPFLPKPANYSWPEDAFTPFYNRMVFDTDPTTPTRLGDRIFDLIIPIGWNDSVTEPFCGSAIFLHVARPDFSATAGCVVIAHDQVGELVRRLRPGMMVDIAPMDSPEVAEQTTPQPIETVAFHGLTPGPRVIVTGAVHGDEPAGPRAIQRAIAAFRSGALRLQRGSVTFVPVVNTLAWRQGTREGERNLNRNLAEYPAPDCHEDRVANILCPLLRAHDVLIDLHSFSADGEPMVLVGPDDSQAGPEPFAHAAAEEALALALGLPLIVHGWVAAHERSRDLRAGLGLAEVPASAAAIGTTEYMRFSGAYGVTVECGQHGAPDAADVGYAAILRGLAHLRLIELALPPARPPRQALEITEPVMALADGDRLSRRYRAGETVRAGERIGTRQDGRAIIAPLDGAIIFASDAARAGTELCFLCRPSPRFSGRTAPGG